MPQHILLQQQGSFLPASVSNWCLTLLLARPGSMRLFCVSSREEAGARHPLWQPKGSGTSVHEGSRGYRQSHVVWGLPKLVWALEPVHRCSGGILRKVDMNIDWTSITVIAQVINFGSPLVQKCWFFFQRIHRTRPILKLGPHPTDFHVEKGRVRCQSVNCDFWPFSSNKLKFCVSNEARACLRVFALPWKRFVAKDKATLP